MAIKHPQSDELRRLADFMDGMAEEDIEVPVEVSVKLNKGNVAAVFKRFGEPMLEVKEFVGIADSVCRRPKAWSIVTLFGWLSDICEQVTELREVKVWKCGRPPAAAETYAREQAGMDQA